jgi:hypothetical protein
MSVMSPSVRAAAVAGLLFAAAGVTQAQSAPTKPATPAHPSVCAAGVRIYSAKADIPIPNDTVALPPGPPIRVTSPEEAEAADLDLRARAGAAGANGILMTTETVEQSDGGVRMSRSVTPMYVPADSARAAEACKALI